MLFFDVAVQQGICGCGVFIIPNVGQKYEIYWNGETGTNNKVEVMALARLLSISDFLNLPELKIYGDFKMIIDHVRSKLFYLMYRVQNAAVCKHVPFSWEGLGSVRGAWRTDAKNFCVLACKRVPYPDRILTMVVKH